MGCSEWGVRRKEGVGKGRGGIPGKEDPNGCQLSEESIPYQLQPFASESCKNFFLRSDGGREYGLRLRTRARGRRRFCHRLALSYVACHEVVTNLFGSHEARVCYFHKFPHVYMSYARALEDITSFVSSGMVLKGGSTTVSSSIWKNTHQSVASCWISSGRSSWIRQKNFVGRRLMLTDACVRLDKYMEGGNYVFA